MAYIGLILRAGIADIKGLLRAGITFLSKSLPRADIMGLWRASMKVFRKGLSRDNINGQPRAEIKGL